MNNIRARKQEFGRCRNMELNRGISDFLLLS